MIQMDDKEETLKIKGVIMDQESLPEEPLPPLSCSVEKHLAFLVQIDNLLVDAVHKDLDFVGQGRRSANVLASNQDAGDHKSSPDTRKV